MKQEMMGWQWHQLDHMLIICTGAQEVGDKRAIAPLLTMIKGQDMYFAPLLKFKKRILFI